MDININTGEPQILILIMGNHIGEPWIFKHIDIREPQISKHINNGES